MNINFASAFVWTKQGSTIFDIGKNTSTKWYPTTLMKWKEVNRELDYIVIELH